MYRWLTIAMTMASACAPTHAKQLPDGSYAIECNAQKVCMDRADRQCGPTGYVIVGGEHSLKVFGVPGNQKQVGQDQLLIRCKGLPLPDLGASSSGSPELARVDGGATPKAAPAKAPVCRPGETQKCVGPGACAGGQSCAADGSGFSPCDCGAPNETHSTKTSD
jgi:hypothetical protein